MDSLSRSSTMEQRNELEHSIALVLRCNQCGKSSSIAPKNDVSENDKSPLQPEVTCNGEVERTQTSDQTSEESRKKRTRIARVTYENGKRRIVDEAVWRPPPDPVKDNYAITISENPIYRFPFQHLFQDTTEQKMAIVSPNLVQAFRSVITYYPGIGLEGNQITFKTPFAPLFFYYHDIVSFIESKNDIESSLVQDLEALRTFYFRWVQSNHDGIRQQVQQGVISYANLWAVFRPGDHILTTEPNGELCIHVLVAVEYRLPENVSPEEFSTTRYPRLAVEMWGVVWDAASETFQRISRTQGIRKFDGIRQISSLPFYPLSYYEGGSEASIKALRALLQVRGEKWRKLVSEKPSCHYYEGPANNPRLGVIHVRERVIVDSAPDEKMSSKDLEDRASFRSHVGQLSVQELYRQTEYERSVFGAGLDLEHSDFDNFPRDGKFSKLQAELCPASVTCYALKTEHWFDIIISRIKDVEWATDTLNQLVLEDRIKNKLVHLVQLHRRNRDHVVSDIVISKGKGLTVVLHGPSGAGKTVTAETIAEHTKKPLYPINISALTDNVRRDRGIVDALQQSFSRASRWDAVLLLDEADVLLEERSYENLYRNGVVSVFLRMLEYYEGILFLTTNRLITMDRAFQSRIQIAVRFPSLTAASRRRIWENFINRLDEGERRAKTELLERLDDLQEWELNGREIRNTLSITESLALSKNRRRGTLSYKMLEETANDTLEFQAFFESTSEERRAKIGSIHSRQFQEKRLVKREFQ